MLLNRNSDLILDLGGSGHRHVVMELHVNAFILVQSRNNEAVNSTRLKTVRSALWRCPNSTVTLRLLENVVKVTNLEVVKIEFRHLPILLSFFFLQPA